MAKGQRQGQHAQPARLRQYLYVINVTVELEGNFGTRGSRLPPKVIASRYRGPPGLPSALKDREPIYGRHAARAKLPSYSNRAPSRRGRVCNAFVHKKTAPTRSLVGTVVNASGRIPDRPFS